MKRVLCAGLVLLLLLWSYFAYDLRRLHNLREHARQQLFSGQKFNLVSSPASADRNGLPCGKYFVTTFGTEGVSLNFWFALRDSQEVFRVTIAPDDVKSLVHDDAPFVWVDTDDQGHHRAVLHLPKQDYRESPCLFGLDELKELGVSYRPPAS